MRKAGALPVVLSLQSYSLNLCLTRVLPPPMPPDPSLLWDYEPSVLMPPLLLLFSYFIYCLLFIKNERSTYLALQEIALKIRRNKVNK